jgi:hypothetical protein
MPHRTGHPTHHRPIQSATSHPCLAPTAHHFHPASPHLALFHRFLTYPAHPSRAMPCEPAPPHCIHTPPLHHHATSILGHCWSFGGHARPCVFSVSGLMMLQTPESSISRVGSCGCSLGIMGPCVSGLYFPDGHSWATSYMALPDRKC